MNKLKKDTKEKFEKCVVCWSTTEVLEETPINLRKNYIEGVGQLCEDCFEELYNDRKKNDKWK